MKLKVGIPAVCLFALASVFAAVPASANPVATVVYDNTGPGTYTTNAWNIFGANTVTDSFTLSINEVLQSANFYVWVYPDDSMTSVTWSITGTPFGAPFDGLTGTAAPVGPNTLVATGFGYYPILEESITIPPTIVPVGTYYLQLTGGVDAYDINVFWDESDGSSIAYNTGGAIPSETFQILASPAPEPSSFLLLGLGMLALAGLATRSKLLA
jgi:hypothetical protein